ncbi:cupin domain-containing protein [Paraburkholderia phymatum]|uniref:Cupin domain-containing protein n=1 Tax=Paraburkholderia phymatum TaxID=148447 RepID=A0ACC6UC18_9BURK
MPQALTGAPYTGRSVLRCRDLSRFGIGSNADFSGRAVVAADQYQWITSPQGGVKRVMLDRLGGETGRATSIVRYASASYFPQHQHPSGEEILALSGTFSEGNQHYPAGWCLRNPLGSSHQPSSDGDAIIFVKLGQMSPGDDCSVRIDTQPVLLGTTRRP